MWTDLPFHVHSLSHQPVACAVYDILYGPPLHLYTTASCTVSVERKNEHWQSIIVFQSRLIYSMTSDFVELKGKKKRTAISSRTAFLLLRGRVRDCRLKYSRWFLHTVKYIPDMCTIHFNGLSIRF